MPPRAFDHNYRLWSRRHDFPESDPLPFSDKWQRLRAVAVAIGLSRDARRRLEWFCWYHTAGRRNAAATCRHFGIARKLFYFWRLRFDEHQLALLEDRSKRPHRVRPTTLTAEQERRIFELRSQYLHYSKMKLRIIYAERYGEEISTWKIQRVIQKYELYPNPKRAARIARKIRRSIAKRRITELVRKPQSGFLFCLDTIVLTFADERRYVITAIDRHSRFAFAYMYKTHTSASASDFLMRLHTLVDGPIIHVQTDNGSEFQKYFLRSLAELNIQQWFSRARTPKDNAVAERFNRTIQEEFIRCGNGYLDPLIFNGKLCEWLIEYNFHRPHTALGYRRPIILAAVDPQRVLSIFQRRASGQDPDW